MEQDTIAPLFAVGALLFIALPLALLSIISGWRIFVKAGRPGWAILIPIYNTYTWFKVAGRPGWWLLLLLIPLVNIVVGIVTCVDISRAFGRGALFTLVLIFFPLIGMAILGFGSSRYNPSVFVR